MLSRKIIQKRIRTHVVFTQLSFGIIRLKEPRGMYGRSTYTHAFFLRSIQFLPFVFSVLCIHSCGSLIRSLSLPFFVVVALCHIRSDIFAIHLRYL